MSKLVLKDRDLSRLKALYRNSRGGYDFSADYLEQNHGFSKKEVTRLTEQGVFVSVPHPERVIVKFSAEFISGLEHPL